MTSWQATTGTPPSPSVGQGTPPDPQIAASSTHVVVGVGSGLLFYTKSGKPYPDGKNYLNETNLFQPLIDGAQLAKDVNGHIDNFNDLRVIFDPYRHRFWTVATGAYRGSACWKGPGCKKNGDPCPSPAPKNSICVKGAATLPADEERMVVGLAVSRDEDPTHGWYLYYWDAAIGWKSHEAPYKPRDMGDYPSIGINATTVDVSNIVTDNWTLPAPGNQQVRAYPHIALYNADDMAAGMSPTIPGWHLYPLISADGKTCSSGFRNENGSCPSALIQPTLAHPDPGGSFLVGREGSDKLSVWKVTDLLQPTQLVTAATVMVTKWTNPKNAPQQGGDSTNYVALKNGLTDPLKSVWRWFLYVVTQDASSTGRGQVRVLRLWVSDFPTIPNPPSSGSNQGSTQHRIGTASGETSSYGWPVIEVNKNNDSVVEYTRSGPKAYVGIRYNTWVFDEPSMQGGRMLKQGEATLVQPVDSSGNPLKDKYGNYVATRWGDLAGASVDFVDDKEAAGIWIVHEYARSPTAGATTGGIYAIWVGKIFGQTYPDWYFTGRYGGTIKVAPGGSIAVTRTIANGGDAAAPATSVRAYLVASSGAQTTVGGGSVAAMSAGASKLVVANLSVPAGTTKGSYTLKLIVDPDQSVAEYGEANNVLKCACVTVG
jgi:hypothetical protein